MNFSSIVQTAQSLRDSVVADFRHFHSHPELSYKEYNTSQKIYDELTSLGAFTVTRPVETGVLAVIKGKEKGPIVAYRADIDALAMDEDSAYEFSSKTKGIMHSCGHDGHTAIALAMARALARNADKITGEIRLIFQPAEELFPGGAQGMVDAGVIDGVSIVLGCHLDGNLQTGKVGLRYGSALAAPYSFTIKVKGKGGHAASPHQTIDSINICSNIVLGFNSIISRIRNPLHRLVITVTQFHAGSAFNIIPDEAILCGTVRILDAECDSYVFKSMESVIKSCCAVQDASYEFTTEPGYKLLINDEKITREVEDVTVSMFGKDAAHQSALNMAGDDFSAFIQHIPGCYYLVGAAYPQNGTVYPHHHPKFRINEDALVQGTALGLGLLAHFTGSDGNFT